MRTALSVAGSLIFLGVAAWQADLPAPLARHYDKLKTAPGLVVEYKFRVIGDAAIDYRLELAKPNLFKLTKGDDFVLSDGTNIYTYTKSTNSYTEETVADDTLAAFLKKPEVFAWSPYLTKTPGSDVASAKLGPNHTMMGNDVTDALITMKKGGVTATLFLDKKIGVARGYDLKTPDKEYLVTASKVDIATAAIPAANFMFSAPSGSKKAEVPKPGAATFAQVQQILTDSCLPCHSASNAAGGVNLSTYAGIKEVCRPGNGAGSPIVVSLRASGRARMPQGRAALSEDKITLIQTWIDNGAKNP